MTSPFIANYPKQPKGKTIYNSDYKRTYFEGYSDFVGHLQDSIIVPVSMAGKLLHKGYKNNTYNILHAHRVYANQKLYYPLPPESNIQIRDFQDNNTDMELSNTYGRQLFESILAALEVA